MNKLLLLSMAFCLLGACTQTYCEQLPESTQIALYPIGYE